MQDAVLLLDLSDEATVDSVSDKVREGRLLRIEREREAIEKYL